ncbi:hypothetical protein CKAN_00634400 [Cinnamomum micranthum f. kanehirae]|uniref:Uncharacterized protein n=1 Tax=Cinnamomum micranthum f. kanehirae TaxID=337451 RepID=A0A3S3NE32_9MAGN|nr:hypothetical protein CKAN_00634400 [Cinnamomum micranthum f. kanehirae]
MEFGYCYNCVIPNPSFQSISSTPDLQNPESTEMSAAPELPSFTPSLPIQPFFGFQSSWLSTYFSLVDGWIDNGAAPDPTHLDSRGRFSPTSRLHMHLVGPT